MRDTDSQIIAIDISSASIKLAQTRIAARKLTNVKHHHLSILDLPSAGFGSFDIIECSGVLHHLADPDEGLRALSSVLKDDGMMAIMVYGRYGRFPVYLVQELMKNLVSEGMAPGDKLGIAREFLKNVPTSHWLTFNNGHFIEDMLHPDGSGIYDLFLHSIDRSYTVPEIYDWLERTKLNLVSFFGEQNNDMMYTPEVYTASPVLREILAKKPGRERQAIAELINGNMHKHHFYAAKSLRSPPELTDDMVITYGPLQWMFASFVPTMIKALENAPAGQAVTAAVRPIKGAPPLILTKGAYTAKLLGRIDGLRSVGQMLEGCGSAARQDLEQLYREMRNLQLVFLRHVSITPYIRGDEIVKRLAKILK